MKCKIGDAWHRKSPNEIPSEILWVVVSKSNLTGSKANHYSVFYTRSVHSI